MRLNNLQTKKENLNLSNEIDKEKIPEHIAIIMDGNGRWATKTRTILKEMKQNL